MADEAPRCERCGRREHGRFGCETIEERTARLKEAHPVSEEIPTRKDVRDDWNERADLD
jgi:hypothetical protein